MLSLVKKFIDESEENKALYKKAIIKHNKKAYSILNKRFSDHMFKVNATSYLHKSIVLNAREFKKRQLRLYKREELTLNTIDSDFSEERIDTISDKTVDFIEEIIESKDIDFTEIFPGEDLISSINNLTDNQREILSLKYVKELEEKEIATRLDISIQAVNKTKKAALDKIKRQLGGAKNNGIF